MTIISYYSTAQNTVASCLWSTGGAQCTPVKQKMKTMSRSLQMLNVARLNVKAQKNQAEAELVEGKGRGLDRHGRTRSNGRNKAGAASDLCESSATTRGFPESIRVSDRRLLSDFSSEAELIVHLKTSYEQMVVETDTALLLSGVQQLLSAVKTFLTGPDVPVRHI